jgi:hypothetical protein
MPQRFAALRAMLRAHHFGPKPISPRFTNGIYTLNSGARHKCHTYSLSGRQLDEIEPPLAAEIGTWTERTQGVSLLDEQLSTENPALSRRKINSVENFGKNPTRPI